MDAYYLFFLAIVVILLWSHPLSPGVEAGETSSATKSGQVQETEVEEGRQYEWDPNGYVLYCPCMGRFGNQASHFLGALAFAQHLNRTLAIPPWRTYVRQRNVPFKEWFQLEPVQSFYKSLPLEDFMSQLAPSHWPPKERTGYCYQPRGSKENDCNMKEGNPFGPFWDELGVEFVQSEFTSLTYDLDNDYIKTKWLEKYPPDTHPVLAFKGAPARFPVKKEHRHLHKYVKWNSKISRKVEGYVKENMKGEPYIGVHLRIGSDWERACSHVSGHDFMESPQCLEDHPDLTLTQEICLPSRELIVRQIKSISKRNGGLKRVFVASDIDPKIDDLRDRLGRAFKVHYLNPDLPQIDLALLGRADQFIGSCASSFSAFVKRERDVEGKPSEFWGVPPGKRLWKNKTEL